MTGFPARMVWHGDASVPACDLIVLPGGFSYGDYLRCGAMAAHSPIMRDVISKAKAGMPVLGICNGFQVLCESGLLPGVLMRNASLKFICRDVTLRVENDTLFTHCYRKDEVIRLPIAHAEGNYFADAATLDRLEGEGRVVFRYCDEAGEATPQPTPTAPSATSPASATRPAACSASCRIPSACSSRRSAALTAAACSKAPCSASSSHGLALWHPAAGPRGLGVSSRKIKRVRKIQLPALPICLQFTRLSSSQPFP